MSTGQEQTWRRDDFENRMFFGNGAELDRIDVISSSGSSTVSHCSEQQWNCSENELVTSVRHHDAIERMNGCDRTKRRSLCSESSISTAGTKCGMASGCLPTPTNMVRRWSQHISRFSKDKQSICDQTIYRLPSRKVFQVDGQLVSVTSFNPQGEILQLVEEIEQHENLMKNTVFGEKNRLCGNCDRFETAGNINHSVCACRETLRALPQPLATKRLVKRQLSIKMEQQSLAGQTNCASCRRIGNMLLYALINLWTLLLFAGRGVEIWRGTMKTIEGRFGSDVSSYFKFLRWLFVLNVLMFLCTVGFITLPQIVYGARTDTRTAIMIAALPAEDEESQIETTRSRWQLVDLFTGEGKLSDSLMFYGSYTNESLAYNDGRSAYSIPHAYYMTMLILCLSTFVVISTNMARSYRKSFIASSAGIRSLCGPKVFCSWDAGIADDKAAQRKHFTIFIELKEALNELGRSKEELPRLWRAWIFFSHLMAHLLVIGMIIGVGVAIRIFIESFKEHDETISWATLRTAAVVNLTMVLLQPVFSWIAKVEAYRSPIRTLHVTLVRNFLLECFLICVILHYWLTNKAHGECWETSLGQEIYRLIIADLIMSLLGMPLASIFRVYVLRRFWAKCSLPEFDISQKCLGLVFSQTLMWIGLIFAPLLAAIMVVKLFLMFHVRKAMLLHLCNVPRHVWSSAQTKTLFLVFSFLSLLGVILALGYIMTQLPVSAECGPFRNYAYMFQILIDGVLKLRQNQKLWRFLMFLIRPAVVGGMLVLMTIMVYYLREKSRAHCLMVKLLKEMIYMEARDRDFLLRHISNLTKQRESHVAKSFSTLRAKHAVKPQAGGEKCGEFVLRSRNV